jgi:hypothetical protein
MTHVVLSLARTTDSYSVGKDFPAYVKNVSFITVQPVQNPAAGTYLSHLNPVLIFTPSYSETYFHIILQSCDCVSKSVFILGILNNVNFSHCSHTY